GEEGGGGEGGRGIGGRDGRDGAARAGARVLPGHAGILVAAAENIVNGRLGERQIGLARQMRGGGGLGDRGGRQGGGVIGLVAVAPDTAQPVGAAAHGQPDSARGGEPQQAPRRQAPRRQAPRTQ